MMINNSKERMLRDICLNHSAGSDKVIVRACPTKLNKQELEDVYYTLVDDNFRLKNIVISLEQKIKVLTAKMQRMTNAQRSILKEKGLTSGSTALVHEQKELIEELQLANKKLLEKIKLLNMQMCSAKQFINGSGLTTRCSKCFLRNSNSMLNSKISDSNLKATSCQYIDKQVMTTRSFMTSVSVNTEKQEQKSQSNSCCEENKCADQIERLKLKISELEQALTRATENHVDAVDALSKLDHQGVSLRQENVTLRSLNSTLEEKLQELKNKLRTVEVQYNELSTELVLEKRKVTALETELKINTVSSINIAKAIEEHMIKMKTEETIKQHDKVRKQLQNREVRSDLKFGDDSGFIDHNTTPHSEQIFHKENHELLRRIDGLQTQIDALQDSKELKQSSRKSSPKRISESLPKTDTSEVAMIPTEESCIEKKQSSSPKRASNKKLVVDSSTDSDTKHDTIKHATVDNIHFSAFFVDIGNTSSPKDLKSTKEKPTDDIKNAITTNGLNNPIKAKGSDVKEIDKQNTDEKGSKKINSSITKRDKTDSKSDTEKRERTRTLSKLSRDKTSLRQKQLNAKKTNDSTDKNIKVIQRERRDSIDSAKTYVVPRSVNDSRQSPENTDYEMSSYSDLPFERDDIRPASVLSPGEDRPRVSSSGTPRTLTEHGSLSEGELPEFRTTRQLSLGEKLMSWAIKRDPNDNMSSTQNAQVALTAVSAEMSRCRQLLRLSTSNI